MTLTDTDLGRAARLKAATRTAHERLDHSVIAAAPFADRARYTMFAGVQLAFHRDIGALYADPALNALLPGLAGRCRLSLIEQDLADLGAPAAFDTPVGPHPTDIPAALGWLYVAEGSNLGAALLLREAQKLGLSETFGARHLAGHAQGRAHHWRAFTTALDAIDLDGAEEARAVAGANATFASVQARVDAAFGPSPGGA